MAEIVVPRGATATYTITISVGGALVNLDNQSLHFSVALAAGRTPFITKRNTAAGGNDAEIEVLAQSGNTLGQCKVKFVQADTQSSPPGDYQCDMWMVTQLGEEVQVLEVTTFRISAAVTLTH